MTNENDNEDNDPDGRAAVAEKSEPVPSERPESHGTADIARDRAVEIDNEELTAPEKPLVDELESESESGQRDAQPSDPIPEMPSWPSDDIDTPIQDCLEYLEQKLDSYSLASTDEFLLQFYHVHAPDPYHDLYLNCLHVRSALRALTNDLRQLANRRTGSIDIDRHDRSLGENLTEVHLALRRIPELRDSSQLFIRCTDLIEDAVLMLQQFPRRDYHEGHVEAFERLQEFYFESAWKLPALRISAETATGPSKEKVIRARQQRLDTFERELEHELSTIVDMLEQVGLVPSSADYPELERTETAEAAVDLVNAYLDGDTENDS